MVTKNDSLKQTLREVEKELTLSKLSRDVIYSRVNLILAK
jgi:hypothetical protein